ncbi:MAG: hypothetical protein R2991_12655 [Thermoanaerobaculia bacterium]
MSSIFDALSESLRSSEPYRQLLAGARRADRLPVPAAAWVVDRLAEDLGGTPLVVVPRESDALAWCEAAELLGGEARFFPAPSLSPYQEADVSVGVRAREAVALDELFAGRLRAVVCTPRALTRRLPRPEAWRAAVREISVGDDLAMDSLARSLLRRGYRRVELVTDIGELAVRGGVLDCFAPGESMPLRLDFFGDRVDSIQRFDSEDQRSRASIDRARLLPLSLFSEDPARLPELGRALRESAGGALALPAAQRVEELERGVELPGWHRHLILLEETVGLPDLLTDPWCVAVEPTALDEELVHYWQRLGEEADARRSQGYLRSPRSCSKDRSRRLGAVEDLPVGDRRDGPPGRGLRRSPDGSLPRSASTVPERDRDRPPAGRAAASGGARGAARLVARLVERIGGRRRRRARAGGAAARVPAASRRRRDLR